MKGIVIGEETTGRVKFNSDPVRVTLPGTGLVVTIPIAVFKLPGEAADRGVIPDVEVRYTIDDLRYGRDLELEAIERLEGNK